LLGGSWGGAAHVRQEEICRAIDRSCGVRTDGWSQAGGPGAHRRREVCLFVVVSWSKGELHGFFGVENDGVPATWPSAWRTEKMESRIMGRREKRTGQAKWA
jgi:hypothetical protein